jgi:hypothetical protein
MHYPRIELAPKPDWVRCWRQAPYSLVILHLSILHMPWAKLDGLMELAA